MWTYVLVAVIVLLAYAYQGKERYSPRPPQRTEERPSPLAAAPVKRRPPPPAPRDPLAAALRGVVERAPPAHGGEEVPYDRGEVHDLMNIVVGRVNDRDPELELHLISVNGVRKAMDPYKTLRYEADAVVYSKSRNVTSKVSAAVDVLSSGRVMVRKLTAHGATSAPNAGPMAATEADAFAGFQPALAY